ncbi:MAG: aldehyde dehydrogenase family protein [Gammaproteobacteria bacterium]|nr:aldehyde dehydrogenase family protein [Gammaproteobacteria bacterium]
MAQHYASMVPGATPTTQLLEVRAPFDDSLIATVATLDHAGVDQALTTAHDLFVDKAAWLSAARRFEILNNAARLLQQHAERLTRLAAREGGKPLIDSRVEMTRAIDGIRLCAQCIRTSHGEEIPMGINAASMNRIAFSHPEPIGVVVALSAFNHPINLIVHQVGPAIAAGCPVIVKPANDTPLSCYELVKIFHQAGLPEAWCQVVSTIDHDVAQSLASDPRTAFLSFIGSAAVGWMLRAKLAPGTRCALEHGGIAPVIVAADADLDAAVPLLAKGGFYHAGQVCISVQRVFAHRSIARAVATGIAAAGNAMVVGDPTAEDTAVGPLIRPRETDRVHSWVEHAIAAGAEKLSGGSKLSPSCYPPTVLFDPPDTAEVSCDEVFGPVICVYPYDAIDEAIARANSLKFAFHAAVFTRDIDTAMHAYRGLKASAVIVNDHTAFRVDWMPFAGLKHSGLGIGGIQYSFEDMQVKKMLVIKSAQL